MILDDKKRVVGKIVSINSDRFAVELLSGLKNFNINGYDDIHYFAQINSYVIVPFKNEYIVAEVVSVRERDTSEYTNAKEQELNKVSSVKTLEVLPIGIIKSNKFSFGVSVYPTLYSDVLYIKDDELDAIFDVSNHIVPICEACDSEDDCPDHNQNENKGKTRINALDIGKSAIFPDYSIKIAIDKFFGSHSTVLGNTGSGKSCTIASMLQTLFKKDNYSAVGSTFVIFDVNGEYETAFKEIPNEEIDIKVLEPDAEDATRKFNLPHHFLTIEEWELLLQASEKTQRPILRSALALAELFSKEDDEVINKTRNHVLATCIQQIMRDETGDPSKSTRILSILRKFETDDISLTTTITHYDTNGNDASTIQYDRNFPALPPTLQNAFHVHFGKIVAADSVNRFLESTDENDEKLFFQTNFQMPNYTRNASFDFSKLGDALELAILYEEAHGNRHIRDYCSSLITRYKSIKERDDFNFIKSADDENLDEYLHALMGISGNKKSNQIVILNLDGLEDELVEIVSSVVTRLLFEKLKTIEPRNSHPITLILEEAHRYISIDPKHNFLRANLIFERVAKEGRKYGLFFLISSQRPSELSKTVLSQCNNFIVHRIQNPDDLSHIRQITPHISETTLKKLPSIPTQHALVFGSSVNIPTLFTVNNADPRPKSDNNQISENWFVDKDKEYSV